MRVKLTDVFRGIMDRLLGIRPKLVLVQCLSKYERGALDVSKREIYFNREKESTKSYFFSKRRYNV